MAKKRLLGEMLVAAGFLTEEQADDCTKLGIATDRRIGDIAVEKGYITQEELFRLLENQHKVPYVDLDSVETNLGVSKHIPVELARRNTLAPIRIEHNVLYVAIEDPKNFRALDEVRTVTRMDVQPMLASGRSINAHIDRIYGNEFAQRALSDYQKEINYEDVVSQITDTGSDDIAGAPIVRLINALLEQAVGLGASDIHIEPLMMQVRVRMRVDGVLSPVLNTPIGTLNAMIARVKILGGLNIAERRAPQDGRFNARVLDREIDVRLSVIPTVHGEKAVMRLLDRSTFLIPKAKLGFTEANLEKFNSILSTPHGIVLVAGPTGSGKSTTLYTMLDEINNTRDNIVTIEDPVEYMIDGLNQTQVNPKAGMGFASGLRSILRQDPDIIMVGEIRDAETVEIAMRAAITGHLVLSTIHTNDAISTIYRLTDMGIPPYMVSASIISIISQRLIRVICPSCKTAYTPEKAELDMAGIETWHGMDMVFYKGVGCQTCNKTGYKGRMAVHEILMFDHILRDLVHMGASVTELRKHALEAGMIPLRETAVGLLNDGVTSLEEIINITHGI
ncbi:MAG: Flp pilus assembly complex ATPase component TadA [Defluviitaleaceae bacterium]|nr:Flp pilus assembly complex ATPase component TadA [Defluviitaleaceae bacterium]